MVQIPKEGMSKTQLFILIIAEIQQRVAKKKSQFMSWFNFLV